MTELNESITTVKKKKKTRVIEGEVVREIWKKLDMNGVDITVFHCIAFSPLTKHAIRQDTFMKKENAAWEPQSPFVSLIVYRNCCPWECKG